MPRLNPSDTRVDLPLPPELAKAIEKEREEGESLVACINRLLAKQLKVKIEQRKRGRPSLKPKSKNT
jgi:hypothetical protein